MDRVSKEKLVSRYVDYLNKSDSVFLVKNSGLSVLESKLARDKLRASDAKFMVVKNSLVKIALKETKFADVSPMFNGPVVVAFADDPVSTSKVLVALSDEIKKISLLGGSVSGKTLDAQGVVDLSKMLTHDEIRAKIVSLLNVGASKIVGALKAPATKLARVLKVYSEQK